MSTTVGVRDEFRREATNADFCRECAMDKGLLIEFLEATQPETMAALSKLYKARRDATIFAKINANCGSCKTP